MKAKRAHSGLDFLMMAEPAKPYVVKSVTRAEKMKLLQFMRRKKLTFHPVQEYSKLTASNCQCCDRPLSEWEKVFLINTCGECQPI